MISAVKARKILSKGYISFLAYMVSNVKSSLGIKETWINWKFLDVFPKELAGLPPKQEVEFNIKLVLGITHISKVPIKWHQLS